MFTIAFATLRNRRVSRHFTGLRMRHSTNWKNTRKLPTALIWLPRCHRPGNHHRQWHTSPHSTETTSEIDAQNHMYPIKWQCGTHTDRQDSLHQPTIQHYSTDTDPSNDPLLCNNYIGPLWRPRVAPDLQIYGRSLVKTLHNRGNSHHLLHVSNHP
ncbi:hypothetical protein NQZ68_021826 [Dissostichus eleginoides]|nr:hypothetical protein NQZ68_021826 [Dissostichus eleginoides]